MNAELSQTLEIIGGLANKASILAMTDKNNSDLQKAIVGIIRGSEFAFEELTGVKYHTSGVNYENPPEDIMYKKPSPN